VKPEVKSESETRSGVLLALFGVLWDVQNRTPLNVNFKTKNNFKTKINFKTKKSIFKTKNKCMAAFDRRGPHGRAGPLSSWGLIWGRPAAPLLGPKTRGAPLTF
jgi:hypothetical protein